MTSGAGSRLQASAGTSSSPRSRKPAAIAVEASVISGTATTTLTAITTSVTRVSGSARAASRSTLRPLTASPSAAKTAAGISSPRTASQSAAADWPMRAGANSSIRALLALSVAGE